MGTKGDSAASGEKRRPVRRRAAGKWSARKQAAFLAALAETANVQLAAAAAKMSARSAYDLRKRDPAFAKGWMDALVEGFGRLEMLMLQRALEDAGADEAGGAGAGRAAAMSERTILSLLNHHRGTVRELRGEAPVAECEGSGEGENGEGLRERVLATLAQMEARLAAANDAR